MENQNGTTNEDGPTTINETEWVSKQEAIAYLGVTPRTLERRAEAGNILKRVDEKQPWQKAASVFYLKEDLEALKAGTPNNHATLIPRNGNGHDAATPATPLTTLPATVVTNGQNGDNSHNLNGATHPTPDTTVATIKHATPAESAWKELAIQLGIAIATKPAEPKPWMTLTEAAHWSGMPLRWIRKKAESGWEGAENIGTGKAKFWRINREALARKMR